jgi:UDP-N-acetylglucosamine acyltransferase
VAVPARNEIHRTAVIEGDVRMGTGNVVGPYAVLIGPLVLGDDNRIGPHSVIGTAGDELRQRRYDASAKRIAIGDRCTIREHVTVHKACYGEATVLGDGVYLMHGSYVAHDTRLGDGAVLAQNAVIGGVARVLEGGYVAMGAALHQEAVLGHYAIVGAAAAAVRSVRPFTRLIPGQPVTVNEYAIERYGFADQRDEIERYVHDRRAPLTPRLAAMVAEYEALCARAGRGEY